MLHSMTAAQYATTKNYSKREGSVSPSSVQCVTRGMPTSDGGFFPIFTMALNCFGHTTMMERCVAQLGVPMAA